MPLDKKKKDITKTYVLIDGKNPDDINAPFVIEVLSYDTIINIQDAKPFGINDNCIKITGRTVAYNGKIPEIREYTIPMNRIIAKFKQI